MKQIKRPATRQAFLFALLSLDAPLQVNMGFHEHNTTHNPQNGINLPTFLGTVQSVPSLGYLCK